MSSSRGSRRLMRAFSVGMAAEDRALRTGECPSEGCKVRRVVAIVVYRLLKSRSIPIICSST
jgi:hypothetical protein